MIQLPEDFMACFVEIVDKLADKAGFNKGDFAQKVWPDATIKANRAKWLHMRTLTPKTGQPQGILLSDALKMAEVLNEDLVVLILRAKDAAISKQAETKKDDAD